MRRILKTSALLAAVTLVAATGAGAANMPSPSYQIAGIEFGGPQGDTSPFVGMGIGSLGDRGFWQASLAHAPFASCSSVGSSCAISAGSFSLRSSNGSQLTGTFTGGSMALSSQAPGCGRQQFAVSANLASSNGSMAFTGTLIYYRLQFHGNCMVLATSVQGSLAPAPAGGGGGDPGL